MNLYYDGRARKCGGLVGHVHDLGGACSAAAMMRNTCVSHSETDGRGDKRSLRHCGHTRTQKSKHTRGGCAARAFSAGGRQTSTTEAETREEREGGPRQAALPLAPGV